jgi:sulfur-oxidizing protein SoxX
MQTRKTRIALAGVAVAVALAGCAGSMAPGPSDAETRAKALELMKAGFNEKGIAKLDRLNQDETQALCTQYATGTIPKDVAEKIEKANMATIKPPSDGKYLGDWKRGEQIAQRGTGFQYSDTEKTPVGGNCYACHQLSKEEISYGTIGPSLYNFGKIRGYTPEMQKYAWG